MTGDITADEYQEIRDRIIRAWWEQVLFKGEPIPVQSKSFGRLGRHLAQAHYEVEVKGNADSGYGDRAWAWDGLERVGQDGENTRWNVADSAKAPPFEDQIRRLVKSGKTIRQRVDRYDATSHLLAGAEEAERRVLRSEEQKAPADSWDEEGDEPQRTPGAGGHDGDFEGEAGPLKGPVIDLSSEGSLATAPRAPASWDLDEQEWERAHLAHPATEALLDRYVYDAFAVHTRRPGLGEPNFDRAWVHTDTIWVAEVKSLPRNPANHPSKLRLALGQVLDYRWRLAKLSGTHVQAVVVVEAEPSGHEDWTFIAAEVGVVVAWPSVFDQRIRPFGSGT